LQRHPLKKTFELGQCRVQGCLTEFFPGLLSFLPGEEVLVGGGREEPKMAVVSPGDL